MMWLLLLGAIPMDTIGDPLPRYLTELDIRKQLNDVLPMLQQCDVTGDQTEPVSFSITGDGSIKNIEWSNESSDAQQCWAKMMTAHGFHEHDDVSVRVSTTIYIRNNILTFSPQIGLSKRSLGPLMLFVLPENSEPVQERLEKRYQQEGER